MDLQVHNTGLHGVIIGIMWRQEVRQWRQHHHHRIEHRTKYHQQDNLQVILQSLQEDIHPRMTNAQRIHSVRLSPTPKTLVISTVAHLPTRQTLKV